MTYTHFIEVWKGQSGIIHQDAIDTIDQLQRSLKSTEKTHGKTIYVWKIKPKNEANRKTT